MRKPLHARSPSLCCRIGCAVALLCALASGAAGATPGPEGKGDPPGRYRFKSYGAEQGLRNLAVSALGQDREGFLWAGSEDGLFRYDGQRFQRFGLEDGVPSAVIPLLYRSPTQDLWAGTEKGLALLVGSSGFRAAEGVPPSEVNDIGATASGDVYVAVPEGLYVGRADRPFQRVAGYPPGSAAALWVEPDGSALIVAQGGALWTRRGSGPFVRGPLPSAERIQAMARDGSGRLWLRGFSGLWRQDAPGAPYLDFTAQLPGAQGARGSLHVDAAGRVWMPGADGLVLADGDSFTRFTQAQGLPASWVAAALVDREGSLWVANEGVHRLLGRFLWTAHTRETGLAGASVWGVVRDRAGTLWVGTDRGLSQGTPAGWVTAQLAALESAYALMPDPDGGLWVGGTRQRETPNAIFHRKPDGVWESFPMPVAAARSTVTTIGLDRAGTLFIGTSSRGLFRLATRSPGTRSPESAIESVPLPGATPGETIDQIILHPDGLLWIAGSRGLLSWDGQTLHRYGLEAGLLEPHVEAVGAAPGGGLLLSYWTKKGISRFEDGRVVGPLPCDPELVRDNITAMAYDRGGALWLGTAQGVKRWAGGEMEQFGRGEGLPGEDGSGNALWIDADGGVFAGTSNGLGQLHSHMPLHPPMPPPTILTQAVDGQGHALAGADAVLPWRGRSLEVHFAVPSFVNESRVGLQVRLEGLESAWRDTDVRQARYASLPAGHYQFEARARLGSGPWGPPAALAFSVHAPWWQSAWFALLALALVLGGSTLLVRARLVYLQHENDRLERLVRARTQELEEATMTDPLTGLRNRRYVELTVPKDVARVLRIARDRPRAPGGALVFLLVDLDRFKSINDSYGHAAGDLVLQQAAQVLRAVCRGTDTVARWGGEEFLVIAQDADRRSADAIASHLRRAIRDHIFDVGMGRSLRMQCSIGFCLFPLEARTPGDPHWAAAVELADRCLYAAKASGRDTWVGVTGAREPLEDLPAQLAGDAAELLARLEVHSSLAPEAELRWRTG